MAAPRGPLVAALLLVSWGLLCSSSSPACPPPCTCQTAPLLNCSSSGLSSVPPHFLDSVTELDLSHNVLRSVAVPQPRPHLRSVWLGDNRITHLSLCVDGHRGGQYLGGRRRPRGQATQGCVSWAPTLQLLSVERNLLEQLPEGLEGLESLQVLQLSFNRITSLQAGDLRQLPQLRVLDLQHNLLTSVHPQTFKDLAQLRVVNLSFNMLTSLHPRTYLTLRNIGADVQLAGNRWQCDCSVRSLKRRMAFDSSRGLPAWPMVCASPSTLSGRDLQQLEDGDLGCDPTENRPEPHRDVTVAPGSQILLTCSTPDSVLWTPGGQSPVNQPEGLLISDISEKDTGLYVCVSGGKVEMIFNLQISQTAKRERRDLPPAVPPEAPLPRAGEGGFSQAHLTMAVCLSVSITFIIAFILGVLARPCIDSLWEKLKCKKGKKETNSESSAGQRQYDNEAFASGEELEVVGTGRERRVTFSTVDFIEDHNVQYYDTVASEDQEANRRDVVVEDEVFEVERRTARDSESDNSSQRSNLEDAGGGSGDIIAGGRHSVLYENIQQSVDLKERRRQSSSSSSDSSLSEMRLREEEMVQRASSGRKVEVRQTSTEGQNEDVRFSSEPFSDWSPHSNPTDLNISLETGEQFDFSDSGRSASVRSGSAFDFSGPKETVASSSEKQRRDETSSSSSSSQVSEDEITHYTVNYDQDGSSDLESHATDPIRTTADFTQSEDQYVTKAPAVRPNRSSSDSSDSDEERRQPATRQKTTEEVQREPIGKVTPLPRQRWRDLSSSVISHGKSPDTRACSSSSSSSDGEAKNTGAKTQDVKGGGTQTSGRLSISGPSSESSSSSSDESADETNHQTQTDRQRTELTTVQVQERVALDPSQRWPVVDVARSPKPGSLNIKAASPATDSSSSSDSEDETVKQMNKQDQWMYESRPPVGVSQTVIPELQTQRPVVRERTTLVKTRQDMKSPSAASDSSSSSDSEDETIGRTNKQTVEKVSITRLQYQTGSSDQSTGWPVIDLRRVRRVKRRLDVKSSLQSSDSSSSSSSSDSENETTEYKQSWDQRSLSQKSDTQWPVVDLQHAKRIKSRLDIKARSPSLSSHSSSSSDSEDEAAKPIKKQDQANLYIPRPPIRVSQTVIQEQATQQPVVEVVKVTPTKRKAPTPPKGTPPLDVGHTTHTERFLDVKAPSPSSDSSSSSDSEGETTQSVQKRVEDKSNTPRPLTETIYVTQQAVGHVKRKAPAPPPPVESGQGSTRQRSTRDLELTTHVEKRLDIKASTPSSDSSSSSDSGDEIAGQVNKQTTEKLVITRLPSETYSSGGWPLLDLQRVTQVKRRLDIKAPPPSSDSSSSSDSEEEMIHIRKQEQGKQQMSTVPIKVSQTHSVSLEREWPSPERHLDIKAPSHPSDTSSSSDSEEETKGHVQKQTTESLLISRLPSEKYSPNATWPILDLQNISRLKRRLHVRVQTPLFVHSSHSHSADEAILMKKQEKIQMSRLPSEVSPKQSFKSGTLWPILDLQRAIRIKRRIDVKALSPSSDSSSSSDSDEDIRGHVQKQTVQSVRTTRLPSGSYDSNATWPILNLQRVSRLKRRLDVKVRKPVSDSSDSSSSSDSEEETTEHVQKQTTERLGVTRLPSGSYDPNATWPLVNLQRVSRLKRRLDVKVQKMAPQSDTSSSSDSEEETRGHIQKQTAQSVRTTRLPSERYDPNATWPVLNLQRVSRLKRRLDVRVQIPVSDSSDSSSSSDSEEETGGYVQKQTIERLSATRLPSGSYDPYATWPLLNLQRICKLKRRLDIKVRTPVSDSSSSSGSEDETTKHKKKQIQEELEMLKLSARVSQTRSYEPGSQWPLLDLQGTPPINRQFDVKAPTPSSESSSSSDSDEDIRGHIQKQTAQSATTTRLSPESYDPNATWPLLDLQRVTRLKRRLDVKVQTPVSDSSDSSSSSDSDDEMIHKKKQVEEELEMLRLSAKVSQTQSVKSGTQWPLLNLQQVSRLKRRLDVKVRKPVSDSSDSSSSSDSEEETREHVQKQTTERLGVTGLPSGSDDPNATWPLVNLQRVSRLKRRLDVKVQKTVSDSSSSSDSEDETTHHKKTQQEILNTSRPPLAVFPTVSHEPVTRQPVVDDYHTTSIKRYQNIKAPSVSSSSSSSDSEEETTGHSKTVTAVMVGKARIPSEGYDPDAQWPLLNLHNVTRVKRRLDIKAPAPQFESASSGSETEHRTHTMKTLSMTRLPSQTSQRETHGVLEGTGGDTNYAWEVKREEAYKVTSSHSSSSSGEEEEGSKQLKQPRLQLRPHLESGWSDPGFSSTLQVKRRLDIKTISRSPGSSSSSDEGGHGRTGTTVRVETDGSKVGITSYQPGTNLSGANKTVAYKPYISRRLDIRAPVPQPDLGLSGASLHSHTSESSSSSDSDDDNKVSKVEASVTSPASETKYGEPTVGMLIDLSASSEKDKNVRLDTSSSILNLRSETTSDDTSMTPEINPELQSRWATMNLGYSRSRQRPVSTKLRGPAPYSPPPDSPRSSSGDSGTLSAGSRTRQRWAVRVQEQTDSSPVLQPTLSSSKSFEAREGSRVDHSLLTTKITSNRETLLTGFESPQTERYLDIKIKEQSPTTLKSRRLSDSISSSSSEDEVDLTPPQLSRGIPRLKRRLNIKAPTPEPSTSPSSSDGEETLTRFTENESLPTYKRLIMKTPSLPNDLYSTRGTSQTDRNTSPAPRRVASINFDQMVKTRSERSQLNTEVPPEIRWTGIGYHLSDLSSTTDRRKLSAASASPKAAPPKKPEIPPPSSSNSSSSDSDEDKKQDSWKSNATLTSQYTTRSVYSPVETTRIETVERPQRKGLSALKAMSSARQTWETKDLDQGASPFVGDPHSDISFYSRRTGLDAKPLSSQIPKQAALPSASMYGGRFADSLHPIPSYRRHDVTEPPQEAPPPIPTTPLPDEDATITWRSPPSYSSREWEVKTFSQQQSRSTNLTDRSSLTSGNLPVYFDSTNISEV